MTRLAGALLLMVAAPIAALAQAPDDPPPEPTTPDPTASPEQDVDVDVDVNVPPPAPPPAPPPPAQPTYEMNNRTYETQTTMVEEESMLEQVGFAIAAGGGVTDFVNDTARDTTDVGGSWEVRATFGTRQFIAGEVTYIGSAQSIDALGLEGDALLLGNGLQAAARFNFTADSPFQPFAFAGVGWRRYELTNVDRNASAINGDDDVLEVPLGVGAAYRFGALFVEGRGEFRATALEDLMPSDDDEFLAEDGQAALHRWGFNVTLGYEF